MLSVNGLDPLNGDDSMSDPDGDGLSNLMEFVYGTDPYDADTDHGGIPDGWEAYYDRNRAMFDSMSAKARFDSDGDGLNDVNVDPEYRFDPANSFDERDLPDSDGWDNLREYYEGTDPTNPDTDEDGRADDADPEPLIPGNKPDINNPNEFAACGTYDPTHSGHSQAGGAFQGRGLAPLIAISWDSYLTKES
jgi:hypothetical protein